MGKTISTHNGSAANREHNIRNPRATDKQGHINKDLKHMDETLHDEKPREAYERIFGEALRRYNDKQTREDRKIKSYFAHIEKDAKKHTVYEMIVQIGDRNDTGIYAPVERECLKEFYRGWKERNPNLECIGAYIHADEDDGTLHMHLDYIPVATGYQRGMEVQNGLVKALEQQGFTKVGARTAQIQWEARENAVLEEICNRHGIEVVHPEGEKRSHMDTELYKTTKKLEKAEAMIDTLEQQEKDLRGGLVELRRAYSESKESLTHMETQKTALQGEIEALEAKKAKTEQTVAVAEQTMQEFYPKLKSLRREAEEKKQTVLELRQEKAEMERELPALSAQISEAKSELGLVQRAIKEEMDKGASHLGGMASVRQMISMHRDKEQKEALRDKLARFAEYVIKMFPNMRELWDRFERPDRPKSKNKDDITK